MTDRPLVFVDTETTSLRPDRQAWEIALVHRGTDHEGRLQVGPDYQGQQVLQIAQPDLALDQADPKALEVGGFYERHVSSTLRALDRSEAELVSEFRAAVIVERTTRGATLVGANVAFDAETLASLLRRHGLAPSWHYRVVDVEALAAGRMGTPLQSLSNTAASLGLKVDQAALHTALGDALLARDIFDAVYRQRGEELAQLLTAARRAESDARVLNALASPDSSLVDDIAFRHQHISRLDIRSVCVSLALEIGQRVEAGQ